MKNIYIQLLDELENDLSAGLATIVETKGSTPQVQGASAIISSKGLIHGTLGGGVLEGDAVKRAVAALKKNISLLYEFDLNANIEAADEAICGGTALILLDSCPEKHQEAYSKMKKSLSANHPGILLTAIHHSSDQVLEIKRNWIEARDLHSEDNKAHLSDYLEDLEKCLERNICLYVKNFNSTIRASDMDVSMFIQPQYPRPKLVIAGAGHIGQAVCHIGNLLDFEVTVMDDRSEYANRAALPEAGNIIVDDIGSALRAISITPETYIVIVTRGHLDDANALRAVVASDAAYIGMIGSKRKISLIFDKFLKERWATQQQLDRVYAPIGLEIGSKTVQEIAVSICAQLVQVRQQDMARGKIPDIHAIILAAGESKRMGKPKLLLPFGKTTIIETLLIETIHSDLGNVNVVLGSNVKEITAKIRQYPVHISENKDFKSGMLSSVQCGIRNLDKNSDAVMILLGDQPMITRSIINDLIHAYFHSSKGITIAVHKGKRGHPIIFSKGYFSWVQQLDPDQSLRQLIHTFPDDIHEVEIDTPDILRDIDTQTDYRNELKLSNKL